MKFLVLVLLVGYVSASFYDALEKESDSVIEEFMMGMSEGPALHLALGVEDSDAVRMLATDIQEELAKHLKKALDDALEKIREAIDRGKEVNPVAWEMLRKLKEKMKELKIEEDEVAGKELEELKAKVDEHLRQILEKMGIFDKRSTPESAESLTGDLDLRNIFLKLREMVLEKMDVEAVKNSLAKLVGQATQRLCEWLTDKGKTKVLNFFDRVLDKDEDRRRSVSDFYDEIKDYFKELDIELKDKFLKFGQWARDILEKGLSKSKNRIENVRNVAKEFLTKTKSISQEVAAEALEFLKEYKGQLGSLYEEVREKLESIIHRQN